MSEGPSYLLKPQVLKPDPRPLLPTRSEVEGHLVRDLCPDALWNCKGPDQAWRQDGHQTRNAGREAVTPIPPRLAGESGLKFEPERKERDNMADIDFVRSPF